MATNMTKNTLLALGIAIAASALCTPSVFAAETKKPVKASKSRSKAKPVVTQLPDGTIAPITAEDEPDITDTITTDFNCELGNKVTVYHNANDSKSIAVRWKRRLHRLTRVGTTTGAVRYENPNFGLIWIGIPAKSMLLDSRMNRQLANECRNAEQEALDKMPAPVVTTMVPVPVPVSAPVPAPMPMVVPETEKK